MKHCAYCSGKFEDGETIKAALNFNDGHGLRRCCLGGTLDGHSDYCVPCFMKLCDPHGPGNEKLENDLGCR